MKLEVENSPTYYQNATASTFNDDTFPAPSHVEMLNHGIRSAQAGNRSEARTALFKVTEIDPRNESAWLWLASISEYPEELLVFLNNVLEINPDNERAKEWTLATNSLLAKTFVQRGIDAVDGNRKDFAAECFNRALEYDQSNEMAWLWMASLSDTNEGKINYLEMVLKVNPDNDAANQAFKAAKAEITGQHLSAAKTAAALGQKVEAAELLKAVIEEDPNCEDAWMLRSHFAETFEEKIASFRSVLRINPENAVARFSLESLQSLMGQTSESSASNPSADPKDHFGVTSGTDLFAYEPEIARDPTQDLEIPAENLEEIRDFAARNESEFAPVEQPAYEIETRPAISFFVEQPVPLSEQDDDGIALESDEPSAVEFEPVPIAMPDANPFSTPFASNVHLERSDVPETADFDNDLTIGVTSPETTFVEENINTRFTFEEAPAEEFDAELNVEDEQTLEASDEVSAPASESSIIPDAKAEDVENYTAAEIVEDYDPGKTEEFSSDQNTFVSEQIMIEAAIDVRDDVANTEEIDPFATVATFSIPENAIPEPRVDIENLSVALQREFVRTSVETVPSLLYCAYCDQPNENSAISCGTCFAILTVSDLDMIIGNSSADRTVIRAAVDRLEDERKQREFSEAELTVLGIGHLNLDDLQQGYNCLQEASKLNPNNVVLSSQVNALLIRLDDVRKHNESAEAMSKGKSILVVDDSPTVRKLIAGKLEKSGHNVFCSADGVEALEMLAGLMPDLILLDINMPRMDGYQTCKSIRSNESTKDIPIVMISGKDGFFDKVRGRMAGTSGYITKPFGPETLMKTVETYLSGNVEVDREVEIEA
jgi:Response regulators consisting of a CheY-like receiver domain and a winged-helix DNA-binding domain